MMTLGLGPADNMLFSYPYNSASPLHIFVLFILLVCDVESRGLSSV